MDVKFSRGDWINVSTKKETGKGRETKKEQRTSEQIEEDRMNLTTFFQPVIICMKIAEEKKLFFIQNSCLSDGRTEDPTL